MTKLFDQAVEAVRRMSTNEQDVIARAMLNLVRPTDTAPEDIDPAHLPDILEGLAQARRREFASDEAVAAAFRRFDL